YRRIDPTSWRCSKRRSARPPLARTSELKNVNQRQRYCRMSTNVNQVEIAGNGATSIARPRFSVLWFALLATWVAYWPALRGGFVWDDYTFIVNGELTRPADGLHRIWLTTRAPDYFPIPYSLMWFEWRWWGANAIPYH